MNIRRIFRIVCSGIILNSFLVVTALATQQANEKIKAPDISLVNTTGESVSLASFIGKKPVLIVFWATWCPTCREEIPRFKQLNTNSFKVIAVNEGESAWKTKRYIGMNNIDYQVVLDLNGSVAKAFQVPGVPACVILNKSGHIVYSGMGLPENIESYAVK